MSQKGNNVYNQEDLSHEDLTSIAEIINKQTQTHFDDMTNNLNKKLNEMGEILIKN